MTDDVAFTGLEAAIILIAFVIVAALFAYVTLGSGFYATQQTQTVTQSGMKQGTSNLIIDGNLYGIYDENSGLHTLTFYLKVIPEGEPQNLANVIFAFTRENYPVLDVSGQITPTDVTIQPGGREKMTLVLSDANYHPRSGERFTLEIKPKTGASSIILKTLEEGYTGGVIY